MNPFKFGHLAHGGEQRSRGDSQEGLRQRLRALKKDFRGHVYEVLHAESEEYEKIIGMYDLEVKHLRRENRKNLKTKNAELKKIKDGMWCLYSLFILSFSASLLPTTDSETQNRKTLLEWCSSNARLIYSIQQSTALIKESALQVTAEFKRLVKESDEEEDKLFAERLEVMEDITVGLAGEDAAMIRKYVKQQEQKIEEEHRKQMEELDLPEEMLEILAQSEKVTKFVRDDYEKEYNEFASLFKDCSVNSSVPKKLVEHKKPPQPQMSTEKKFFNVPAPVSIKKSVVFVTDTPSEGKGSSFNSAQYVVDTQNTQNTAEQSLSKVFADSNEVHLIPSSSGEPSSQLFINESDSQEKLTTKIERIDFEIPDSADDQNIQMFDFEGNGNLGEDADDGGFQFNFEDSKSEEFQFNF